MSKLQNHHLIPQEYLPGGRNEHIIFKIEGVKELFQNNDPKYNIMGLPSEVNEIFQKHGGYHSGYTRFVSAQLQQIYDQGLTDPALIKNQLVGLTNVLKVNLANPNFDVPLNIQNADAIFQGWADSIKFRDYTGNADIPAVELDPANPQAYIDYQNKLMSKTAFLTGSELGLSFSVGQNGDFSSRHVDGDSIFNTFRYDSIDAGEQVDKLKQLVGDIEAVRDILKDVEFDPTSLEDRKTLAFVVNGVSSGELSIESAKTIAASFHDVTSGIPDVFEVGADDVSSTKPTVLYSAAATGLAGGLIIAKNLGVLSDLGEFLVTSAKADEFIENGQPEEAAKLWSVYAFELAGASATAGAGANVGGTYGGFWGALAGGVAGGIVGSIGGKALGELLYDRDPLSFQKLFPGHLPTDVIGDFVRNEDGRWANLHKDLNDPDLFVSDVGQIEELEQQRNSRLEYNDYIDFKLGAKKDPNSIDSWTYAGANGDRGIWMGADPGHLPDAETIELLDQKRAQRLELNATVDAIRLEDYSEAQGRFENDILVVSERIYGSHAETIQNNTNWLNEDAFQYGTTDFDSLSHGFDIATRFIHGNLGIGTENFGSHFASIRNDGLIATGGNWQITSVTANNPGFWAEVNAAISDWHQPGRANVIHTTASREVSRYWGDFSAGNLYRNTRVEDIAFSVSYLSRWSTSIAEVDPLVLDLDGDGVELTSFSDNYLFFDIDNDGHLERTGWVAPDDAMLVHDLDGNGRIDDITETLSEYYGAASGTGAIYGSSFEALTTLDSNGDGVVDQADSQYAALRLWQDANQNGQTDEGELVTLVDAGVTLLSLSDEADGAFVGGNEVKSNSTYTKSDGSRLTLAAVNFIADPSGLHAEVDGQGIRIELEDGSATYTVGDANGEIVTSSDKGATNLIGGIGDDVLTGDDQNNWLVGSLGSDTLHGGGGNDYLVADAADISVSQSNVQGGTGFDVAQFVGDQGIIFNLQKSQVEMAIGTDHADILSSGSSEQSIINGGAGDDIIFGGGADDVLNGEEGKDAIYGNSGDDLIRGHRGADTLEGGLGNDILQGGLGEDVLRGGAGEDLLTGGQGDDHLHGGGGYDVAEYSGSYADYIVTSNLDGTYTVTDRRNGSPDGADRLSDVEALNFADINEVQIDGDNPLPVKDVVRVSAEEDGKTYRIAISDLLANDLDYQGDSLSLREAFEATGGSVSLDDGEVVFVVEDGFSGIPSFSYRIADEHGNNGIQVGVTGTDLTAEMTGKVTLVLEHHPEDPQFLEQWYLPEINVLPVWKDYTGQGVTVGVFEPGPWDAEDYGQIDYSHPDLLPNIDQEALRTQNPNIEPTQHATLVAGVIGAARNDIGSVGVAYNSTLASEGISEKDISALRKWGDYDVANNSWGPEDQFGNSISDRDGNSKAYMIMESAIHDGREGLGTILVMAGGNGRQKGFDTNGSDLTNNRYGITVGAINAEGDLGNLQVAKAPFSNPGASILISAPGSNITSTSRLLENANGSIFGSDYETTQGTSLAAPIVSGVVALMLEANPSLGWRDVQEILAMSAEKIDDPNTEWHINGAVNWNGGGMHYSQDYGFGLVNAHAAVRLAETWQKQSSLHNEVQLSYQSGGLNSILPDGVGEFANTISVADHIKIENVEVQLDLHHMQLGDVEVLLVGPDGTESVLINRPGVASNSDGSGRGYDALDRIWLTSTTNHWGEYSAGDWTLIVKDKVTGESGKIRSWELRIFGEQASQDDLYVYTGEFSDQSNGDSLTVSDGDGYDIVNTSAILEDVIIDLSGFNWSKISGQPVVFNEGASIETVYAGDGNDLISGNKLNNILFGGRGHDLLRGNTGDDIIFGGNGDDIIQYTIGDGADVIESFYLGRSMAQGMDTLSFEGIGADDVALFQSGYDLNIQILSSGERIRVTNNFRAKSDLSALHDVDQYAVDQIIFSDGTKWNTQEILDRAIVKGSSEADLLYGTENDEKFNPGTGNDSVFGGGGNDTFLWKKGDGNDTISASIADQKNAEHDVYMQGLGQDLLILEDVLPNEVEIERLGSDIVFTVLKTGEKITLAESYVTFIDYATNEVMDNAPVDFVSFSNGDVWTLSELKTLAEDADGVSDEVTLRGAVLDERFPGEIAAKREIIRGTRGDDLLQGTNNNDVFRGGLGDDTLFGGDGDDVYLWKKGDGNDKIAASSLSSEGDEYGVVAQGLGQDLLILEDVLPNEVDIDRVGYDLVIKVHETGETITLSESYIEFVHYLSREVLDNAPAEIVKFSNGIVWTLPELEARAVVRGTDGDDTLLGTDLDDVFEGGRGDDVIYGFSGNDQFLYAEGDGNDVIKATIDQPGQQILGAAALGDDMLVFKDLNEDDVELYRDGVDIKVKIKSTGELITFEDQLQIFINAADREEIENISVDVIRFADGTTWTARDIALLTPIEGTNGNDYLTGSHTVWLDVIVGGRGDDTIRGANSRYASLDVEDVLIGGSGDDKLYGYAGSDVLDGGYGDDFLNGGAGEDRLEGGEGNDRLLGDADADVIIGGNGIDEVYYYTSNAAVIVDLNDALPEHGGHAEGDVLFSIENILGSSYADTLRGDDEGNSIDGYYGDDLLYGLGGDDDLKGAAGNDTIYGGAGSDLIYGGYGDDYVVGGLGDDHLQGGGGHDVYKYYHGDGNDVISDFKGVNIIDFDNISSTEVIFDRIGYNGADLQINVGEYSDSIVVKYYFDRQFSPIFSFNFADNAVLGFADLEEQFFHVVGTDQDDLLNYVLDGDYTITGGAGDDTIVTSAGDDTFVYALGDGNDIIRDRLGENRLILEDINADQVVIIRSGASDIDIKFKNTNENIHLEDVLLGSVAEDFRINFADGVVWNKGDLAAQGAIFGSNASDNITGSYYNDVIEAGRGDDNLQGGYGDDTYIFNSGDGVDQIIDGIGTNIVKVNGVAPSDVGVVYNSEDIVLELGGNGDSIVLDDFLPRWNQEIVIKFDDGTEWLRNNLLPDALSLMGSNSDEVLSGGHNDDLIEGGSGDDELRGGIGSDKYVYSLGDGNDVILDGNGANSVLLRSILPEQIELASNLEKDLLVNFIESGERLTIKGHFGSSAGTFSLEFSDGSSWGAEEILRNTPIYGTDDNDYLSGTSGDDIISGAQGNDTLAGGGGNDTYIYNRGDGNDEVLDRSGQNTLILKDIISSDVYLCGASSRNGYVIDKVTWETIYIPNAFSSSSSYYRKSNIQKIKFADGVVWDRSTFYSKKSDIKMGSANDDRLYGNSTGKSTLIGGEGDDQLNGYHWIDDEYIYRLGDGNDVIVDFGGRNQLSFANVSKQDIEYFVSYGDLMVKILATGSEIKILDASNLTRPIDTSIKFFDGTVFSSSYLAAVGYSLQGVSDQLDMTTSRVLEGTINDDVMSQYHSSIPTEFRAGAGADIVNGTNADDVIFGGIGNDTLRGGAGDDIYLFSKGDGQDIVSDISGNNHIVLLDVTDSEVEVERVGESIKLIVTNTEDTVLVSNALQLGERGLGSIRFNDGTIWGHEELLSKINEFQVSGIHYGTSKNDVYFGGENTDDVSGESGNDYLNGKDGNDYLYGGSGADRIIGGEGADWLEGNSGSDLLVGGAGDDTFYFGYNFDMDTIADFQAGPAAGDVIQLDNLRVSSFEEAVALAEQQENDVVFDFGRGDTLTLLGVNLSNLTSDDFWFS
ncbi:proprotein convertase P [Roseibium sp. TrichSKD4]|uniref:calcium-binding protein n=1 Tax=Roseibium sp. TrichSKD4 TaxID=744980 RepID=UPI0001E56545|nr:calcium-binding protein [Roseibium sp. TrichSKD4]EFO34067.1 proprotein convertase P [Roseibium sp. TrichSKD4]